MARYADRFAGKYWRDSYGVAVLLRYEGSVAVLRRQTGRGRFRGASFTVPCSELGSTWLPDYGVIPPVPMPSICARQAA